jgi:hypothetical protein
MQTGTVYLYPVVTDVRNGPGIEYKGATEIVRREVPAPAIEFVSADGNRIISTLPYTVVYEREGRF